MINFFSEVHIILIFLMKEECLIKSTFFGMQDPKTGNWWLAFGENMKPIGYWPKSLFKFIDIGDEIYWGGEVVNVPSMEPSSQMGSGHFPSEGYKKAAFVANAKIVNENNLVVTPNIESLFTIAETPNCYQVGEPKVREGGGVGFFFGGPGGCKS
jgi:Neprosin